MGAAPLTVKLRCKSWDQLRVLYERDLRRGGFFLRARTPPPLGTPMRLQITLPSDSVVLLSGVVDRRVEAGELEGRGAGIDLALDDVSPETMWLIESALGVEAARPPRASTNPGDEEAVLEENEDLTRAESELVAALWSELESIGRLNPFQVLGVGYEVDDDGVRSAFGALTKKYHPDRFARYQSDELQVLASEVFILVRDAYRQLGTQNDRERTLQAIALRSAAPAQPAGIARDAARDRRRSDRARSQLGAQTQTPPQTPPPSPIAADSSKPRPSGSAAATARPTDVRRAFAMLEDGDRERALGVFRVELRKDPSCVAARAGIEVGEGLRSLARGDRLDAAQRFEAALALDPSVERAARELAEMRRQAVLQRRSQLAKLMGTKE